MKRIRNISFRKLAPWLIGTLVLVVAAGALASTSKSDVTRARLERSLPQVFSNIYVQQAALLGHKGVTVQSMKAKAQCDKGGPNVPDRGPGADWICVMSWHDKNVDETLMPGKFEINAHSNDCYTAGGPSKLVGLLTITDKNGKDVPNPAFEFDGCFDPHGSNKPTGVDLNPKTPRQPPPLRSLSRPPRFAPTRADSSSPPSPAHPARKAAAAPSPPPSTASRSRPPPTPSPPATTATSNSSSAPNKPRRRQAPPDAHARHR